MFVHVQHPGISVISGRMLNGLRLYLLAAVRQEGTSLLGWSRSRRYIANPGKSDKKNTRKCESRNGEACQDVA